MADDWLGISSANLDSKCGEDGGCLLAEALDGIDYWQHNVGEVHWFILDLGQTYSIKKVRGRSKTALDPTDVDIFVSDDKENWGDAVATGINTWQDTAEWVEVDTTDKDGRYIKVVINATEFMQAVKWGKEIAPFITIFDVYGDVVGGPETHTPSDTAKATDSPEFKAKSPLSDLAKASDSPKFKAEIPLSDTAKASDSMAFKPGILLSDLAKASEMVKFKAKSPFNDTAKATDSPEFKAKSPLSDLAKASDSPTFKPGIPLSDLAKASDSVTFKVFHSINDVARAQDIIFPDKLTLTDIAKANDSVTYRSFVDIETPTDDIQIFRNDLSL